MTLYQRKTLSTGANVGDPGPLPAELVGLDDATLADLPAALSPVAVAQLGFADTGFVASPPPTPPRPDLPKSTVTQRLIDLGKADAVMAVLEANKGLFALWFAPDWQRVYKDDERVLPILTAAGLTEAEIAEVMA